MYTTLSRGMPAFPAPLPRAFVRWSIQWFSIGAKHMLGHAASPPPLPLCVCVFSLFLCLPCDVHGAVTFFVRASTRGAV